MNWRCIFRHRWAPWEFTREVSHQHDYDDYAIYEEYKRVCERCGKKQYQTKYYTEFKCPPSPEPPLEERRRRQRAQKLQRILK